MVKQMVIVNYVIKMVKFIKVNLKMENKMEQDLKQVEEEKKQYNIKME